MFKEILTNPLDHRSNDYAYCVYAFHQSNRSLRSIEEIGKTTDRFHDPSKLFRASLIGQFDSNVARKKFGLYQNISQTGMFGKVALILSPKQEDQIRIAWNCDLASGMTEDQLIKFVAEHDGKVMNPYRLLTDTVGSGDLNYNELILRGHSGTEIRGVCYRGNWTEQYLAQWITVFASQHIRHNIPVISIEKSTAEDGKIDRAEKTGKTLGEIMATIPRIIQARKDFLETQPKP